MNRRKKRVKAQDYELNKKQRTGLISSSEGTLTKEHGWDKKAVNKQTNKQYEKVIVIDKNNPLAVTRGDHLALNVTRATIREYIHDHPDKIHPLTGEPVKVGDKVVVTGKVNIDADDLEGLLEGHEREALSSPRVSIREKQQIAKSAATRERSIVESETLSREKPMRVQRLEEEERRRLAEEARKKEKESKKEITNEKLYSTDERFQWNHQKGEKGYDKPKTLYFNGEKEKIKSVDNIRVAHLTSGSDEAKTAYITKVTTDKGIRYVTTYHSKNDGSGLFDRRELIKVNVKSSLKEAREEINKHTYVKAEFYAPEQNLEKVYAVEYVTQTFPTGENLRRLEETIVEDSVYKKKKEVIPEKEEEYQEKKERIMREIKEEQERPYTPEEEEAIKLAILKRYPGLEEDEFNFGKGLNGMVDIRFRESGKFSTNGIWEKSLLEEGEKLKTEKKEPRLVEATINDIDAEKASRAYHGTSFSPEQRGLSDRRAYANHVNSFYDDLYSKVSEEQRDELVAEMVKYKEFYKNETEEQLHRHSGLASTMIAGGSNFPAQQMNKKSNMFDKKRNEFYEKDARVQRAIKKRLGLIKPRGISSDDDDAVERLEIKIKKKEAMQERMKAANKIIRSKKLTDEEKVSKIQEIGYDEESAEEILRPNQWTGKIGFESWRLSNNSSEIRRLKKRKTHLEKQRLDTTSTKTVNGVEIEDNVEDNRLRILFDEKPDPETIRDLKSNGFKWSPRNSAWQRYRSSTANYEAERITKKYAERNNLNRIDMTEEEEFAPKDEWDPEKETTKLSKLDDQELEDSGAQTKRNIERAKKNNWNKDHYKGSRKKLEEIEKEKRKREYEKTNPFSETPKRAFIKKYNLRPPSYISNDSYGRAMMEVYFLEENEKLTGEEKILLEEYKQTLEKEQAERKLDKTD